MYNHFLQFTLPRIGQLLLGAVLYLNFLTLPFVAPLAGRPLLYYGLPLLLVLAVGWVARDPLGIGLAAAAQLCGLYLAGDLVSLLTGLAGAPAAGVWRRVWMGGLLAWALTAAVLLFGYWKAMRLCVTTYRLSTPKPLPGGRLRILQISDLHPGRGAMDRRRIPELRRRIQALQPDLIAFTGDIFDEYTPRADFEAFLDFFAALPAPLGKWFVLGNHDLFHYWRQPAYTRAELESRLAEAASACWRTRPAWPGTRPAPMPRRCGSPAAGTGWTPTGSGRRWPTCCPAAPTGCIPSCWTTNPGNLPWRCRPGPTWCCAATPTAGRSGRPGWRPGSPASTS